MSRRCGTSFPGVAARRSKHSTDLGVFLVAATEVAADNDIHRRELALVLRRERPCPRRGGRRGVLRRVTAGGK